MGHPLVGSAISNRLKRRRLFLLRGLLTFAVGGLFVQTGPEDAGPLALAIVVAYAASNVLLLFVPQRTVASPSFDVLLGAIDLALVILGIQLTGPAAGALPVSCLLMVLVVAIGNDRSHAVAGATAVGALHAWMVTRSAGTSVGAELILQILFLCAVGLHYGFLSDDVRMRRRKQDAEALGHIELTTLLDILEAATSSLRLADVHRAIVEKLATVVPALRCSILCTDAKEERAWVLASHDDPTVDMLEIDLRKYPEIRRAIETREPVVVQDVSRDPVMESVRDRIRALDFQSILVIPLTFGPDVLGTLCLKTARVNRPFTDREIQFCTAVARASSNALKNAFSHRLAVEEARQHRETSEKLASILDHSPDLILSTNNRGVIVEFNREAERVLGYSRAEVIGQGVYAFLAAERDSELVSLVREEGSVTNRACRLLKKDGGEIEIEMSVSVLRDESGEVAGAVWLGRDVTGLRAAEKQLAQAERLASIGEVISGVAHEINNPLSTVLGFSQLVLARQPDNPAARELRRIRESADRCQRIVKNLLSFARAQNAERKKQSLNAVVRKTIELRGYHLRVAGIEVETNLDDAIPAVEFDFRQMQQVFLNLISNAEHAITAARRTGGRISIRSRYADDAIRVEVADDGIGMDAPTLQRVFDPFFTTKGAGRGTGLGLSVSYGIVREHGGRIRARSVRGEGSVFLVEIPVAAERIASEDTGAARAVGVDIPLAAASPTPGGTPRRGRVLVVDDEPTILELLEDLLVESGHSVSTAANGAEAARMVRAEPFDVVITDIRMPEMNGMDLYRDILCVRPELDGRIIFITGDLVEKDTLAFLDATGALTIPKPLDIDHVARAVATTLETPARA